MPKDTWRDSFSILHDIHEADRLHALEQERYMRENEDWAKKLLHVMMRKDTFGMSYEQVVNELVEIVEEIRGE